MDKVNALRETLHEDNKDLKLNLQAVLSPEKLTADQTWGCAIAAAMFLQDQTLCEALVADATDAGVGDAVISDARASAGIMAMNTIYYRFRHMIGDEKYTSIPPKLRMMRMSKPATDKTTFELMSMSCAALEGCEMCLQSHAKSLENEGASADQVHEAVRVAAAVRGFSTSRWLAQA
jgi:alkyl hydroperoxide reductase subunit D